MYVIWANEFKIVSTDIKDNWKNISLCHSSEGTFHVMKIIVKLSYSLLCKGVIIIPLGCLNLSSKTHLWGAFGTDSKGRFCRPFLLLFLLLCSLCPPLFYLLPHPPPLLLFPEAQFDVTPLSLVCVPRSIQQHVLKSNQSTVYDELHLQFQMIDFTVQNIYIYI